MHSATSFDNSLPLQYKEYGYIPAALPDSRCFGEGSSVTTRKVSAERSLSLLQQRGRSAPALAVRPRLGAHCLLTDTKLLSGNLPDPNIATPFWAGVHDRLRALIAQHLEQRTALLHPRLRQTDSKWPHLSFVCLEQHEYLPLCQPP